MGNVCSSKTKNGGPRKLTLAILGLDNAGKTVTTKGLQGETLDTVAPTIGFSQADFVFNNHQITLFDLGGGRRIRDIWKNYFSEVYGVIYVVDSSEPERLEECKACLLNLLGHDKVSGKPVLILANKQDKAGALDELDICEQLDLERIVNKNKCPCRVETCTAILGQGKKLDKSIKSGMSWLLQTIANMHDKLSLRVEKDVSDMKEKEAREKEERRAKVRMIREERDRQEAQENGFKPGDRESDDDHDIDPFKRVDAKDLVKKEQRSHDQKRKNKELELRNSRFRGQGGGSSDPEDHGEHRPRASPRLSSRFGASSDPEDNDEYHPRPSRSPKPYQEESDSGEDIPPQRIQRSLHGSGETFSKPSNGLHGGYGRMPLGPSPRLNMRKDMNRHARGDSNSDEETSDYYRKSQWNNERSLRPYDLKPAPSLTPRLSPRGLGAGEEEAESRTLYGRRPLVPLAPLEPLDGGDVLKKKKKKKAKKNQTSPLAIEDGDMAEYKPKVNPFAPRGWNTPPGQRSMLKASLTPRLETLKEPDSERSDTENMNSFSNKWGLMDDLPELPSTKRSMRPNSDYDYDMVT